MLYARHKVIRHAQTRRSQLRHEVSSFMKQYEFLVWPTHLSRPYAVDDSITEHAMDWTPVDVAPLLGLPAITVPCGFDSDGLPVGLQIMGQHGADADVIKLAQAFENETNFWMRRPTL